MESAKFQIGFTTTPLTAVGIEKIDFLFTANEGHSPRAIEKIASGGEMSRVMLALKSIISRSLALPTIIFDEIDTGVSGRIADAMGDIISTLALDLQIIDITHLPQVASKRGAHFVVYKSDGHTNIRRLDRVERVDEIAKMLSGSEVTSAALEQARLLLGEQ